MCRSLLGGCRACHKASSWFHRFRNTANEPCLARAVVPCLRDDIQLSVDVYRNKLYELIASRKTRLRNSTSSERISDGNTSGMRTSASLGTLSTQARRPSQPTALPGSSPARNSSSNNNHHSTSQSGQPIKVKVVARKVERAAVSRVEEGGRRSSKDSDKSSAKSNSSSSSPGSSGSGRHKSISPPLSRPDQRQHHHHNHHSHHSGMKVSLIQSPQQLASQSVSQLIVQSVSQLFHQSVSP